MAGNHPQQLNSGSRWQRWDPHVHTPGTILNDQFGGPEAWEKYLLALETSEPAIRALGITDYYVTPCYERVCEARRNGRIKGCDLVFPNVEMRLGVGTLKGGFVNVHLLVCPDDANHLTELHRFLARLSFRAHDDNFTCTPADLVRLGRRSDPSTTDDAAALRRGCEQFKVSLDDLRQARQDSAWARKNILVAVAGSETDGTSGVRGGAEETLRAEIEKFADIIFASSAAQREFWLGLRGADESELRSRYGGLKPCMHGSDAHDQKSVAAPDGNRYSWIKGAASFDTLRQACIEPAGRAFVGEAPPVSATPSQTVDFVELQSARWAQTPRIALNPGLVAIIGARGSGKTALADVIALGCDATRERLTETSFLVRANELFKEDTASVRWAGGMVCRHRLDRSDEWLSDDYPRAQYLSQQFVEKLCSADGMTDELMQEVQRVIFEAHPLAERDGAVGFDEMLEMRATRFREARRREEEALADLSEQIGTEIEKVKLVAGLERQVAEKQRAIAAYIADRAKLVSKGSEGRLQRLADLAAGAEKVRSYLRYFAAQEQALLGLHDEVGNVQTHQAPEALRKMKERYKAADMQPEEWQPFLLDYKGDVHAPISAHLTAVQSGAAQWRGLPQSALQDVNAPLIASDAALDRMPLSLLEAETARLEKLISLDRDTANRFSAISRRLDEETTALNRLGENLTDCKGAKERIQVLADDREAAYVRVFDAVLAEQKVLTDLYSPLMARLEQTEGSLKKLSFTVARHADIERWADEGEQLLDLRQKGPFKGRGTLRQIAGEYLQKAWETGSAQAVTAAMAAFRTDYQDAILERSQVPKSSNADYRAWLKRFAKWLYGTDHVAIRYSVDYDGVDIRKLSPGTRGIVLLLLYLALDDADDRPLIIDQPEENLDPKSIFDELVPLFVRAKNKRQVIMVTHNANLVVNTDADQIIVAEAGPHPPGELPPITYLSGGLESAAIRKAVCDILEGGERAFQERARRLRVRLER